MSDRRPTAIGVGGARFARDKGYAFALCEARRTWTLLIVGGGVTY
jgi:hypothetical protein